jgi:hypothetical protein
METSFLGSGYEELTSVVSVRNECDKACAALDQSKVRTQTENWENTVSMVSLNFITAIWSYVQCHSHIWVTFVYTHEIITTYIASSTAPKKSFSWYSQLSLELKTHVTIIKLLLFYPFSLRNYFWFLHSFT